MAFGKFAEVKDERDEARLLGEGKGETERE
jgi:hypothetical protein